MQLKTKCLVKTTGTFLFSCFLCAITYGQTIEKTSKKIYLQAGLGATGHNGVFTDIGVQAVLKNNWTTSLSYNSIDMDPKNIPSDYDPGYAIVLFIPIENKTPSIDMKVLSFMVGKYYKGGRNTWFTTEGGLSLITAKELNFSKRPDDPSYNIILFGEKFSNYTHTEEKKTTMGAMLKADFNWAFASFAGVGAGVFANLNSIQSPVGFQIKLLIGKMNKQKKR